jgi:polyketide synthase PksN
LDEEGVIREQQRGVLVGFRLLKALLELGYGEKELGWTLITTQCQATHKHDAVNPAHASLYGLIGTMANEQPGWHIRIADLQAGADWPLADLFFLPKDTQGNALAYRDEEWHEQKLVPIRYGDAGPTQYRQGGVYVVIGGAGGIGAAWSDYMIRTYQAQIVWIGRRLQDAEISTKIASLARSGPAPLYVSADATDLDSLQTAYRRIKERYPQIHGVVHSAIVLADKTLSNMDEERFQAGLSAQVEVSVRLAQAFAPEPLDFILFFSAMNAFVKNAGQSNYVAGCTFKDAFAHHLMRERSHAVKIMNWGYWGSVGVGASQQLRERMARAGVGSIESPEAMAALEQLLAGPVDQIGLLKTASPLAMLEGA